MAIKSNPLKTFLLLCLTVTLLLGADKEPRPSIVVTAVAESGMINPLQNYTGTLYYDRQSKVASEFEGIVKTIHFQEGSQVKKGQVLVTLDDAILKTRIAAKKASVKAMEAEFEKSRRDLERSKVLYGRQSISQSNYDQFFFAAQTLEASLDALRQDYQQLLLQQEKYRIRSPFSGVAISRNVEAGEWVAKGGPVAAVVDESSLEGRVNIPARFLETVRHSTTLHGEVEHRDVDVQLKNVIPVADKATRSFTAEFSLSSTKGLIEGMSLDVKVPLFSQKEALLVPRDAVIKRFGQMVVFAAVDGKAMMFPVQVVGYKTDMAAVEGAGLQSGMRIIVKGNERVFPNMPVVEKE